MPETGFLYKPWTISNKFEAILWAYRQRYGKTEENHFVEHQICYLQIFSLVYDEATNWLRKKVYTERNGAACGSSTILELLLGNKEQQQKQTHCVARSLKG